MYQVQDAINACAFIRSSVFKSYLNIYKNKAEH